MRGDERAGDVVELAGRDPRLDVLADVRDRRGDEVAGAGDALDLLGSLADDHAAATCRASSIWAKTSSTLAPASIVHERSRRPGSARRPALSAHGRWRAAAPSPRACRRPPFLVRAPERPLGCRLVVEVEEQDRVERPADRASISSSASAWTRLRGNPSRMNPRTASSCDEPVADQGDRQLVGDELAGGEDRRDPEAELGPVGDRSPEHVPCRDVGTPWAAEIRFACVPFPDPCGPRTRTLMRRYLRKPS